MRTVRHLCDKLSNWECMELYASWRMGTPKRILELRYGMSGTTINQTIERAEAAARGLGLSTRRMRGERRT